MLEDNFDRRRREKAEEAEAEKRKQERAAHYKAQQLPEIWKAQAAQAANTQAWCEWLDRRIVERVAEGKIPVPLSMLKLIGEAIAMGRKEERKETKAAIEDAKREFAAKLEAMEHRIMPLIVQRADRPIAGRDGKDADPETVARIVGDRIEAPLREFVRAQIDAQFTALERRLVEHIDRRINEHIAQTTERTSTFDDTLARERQDRQSAIKSAADMALSSFKAELSTNFAALEQRLKETPGKFPAVKFWQSETVVYQGEFVAHEGCLFQAKRDTAQAPGGSDWICCAVGGRPAVTPVVRGNYDTRETYNMLNIVAMDGGSFIAKYDNPGVCPGAGWQLLCKQGKRGRPGEVGPKGPRGEKGEKGEDGLTTVSWQLDRANYRMSPLMNNGTVGPTQEFHGMFEQFIQDRGD